MKLGYTSLQLIEQTRKRILETYKPKFEVVDCHHITLEYGVIEIKFPTDIETANIIGYICGEDIECLLVRFEGCVVRDTKHLYHITLSKKRGVHSYKSNDIIKNNTNHPVRNMHLNCRRTWTEWDKTNKPVHMSVRGLINE